jgi:hypothetical protein
MKIEKTERMLGLMVHIVQPIFTHVIWVSA